ncbi:MAG TPA: TSUP family transporter, partial [Ramlibacter sp.]|nr:TSUP family transporter [Ramlibacter sp.]
ALILLGLTGLLDLAPLPDAANVATVLSVASAAIALRGARRAVDWSMWRPTVLGAVFGTAAGVALLAWLSANVVMVLRLLLGIVVIACAVVVLLRTHALPRRSPRATFHAFGFLSGLLGGLFSASGPPLVYQYYRQPLSLEMLRDTLVATISFAALLRLLMVIPSGQFGLRSLWMCLASLPLAMGITWWMRRHPPSWRRDTVLKIVCVLLVITGLGLVGPAVQALAGRI